MPRNPSLLHSSRKQQRSRQYQAVAQSDGAGIDRPTGLDANNKEQLNRTDKSRTDQRWEQRETDGARRRIASRNRSSSNSAKVTASASINNHHQHDLASSPKRIAASLSETGSVETDGLNESYRLSDEDGTDDTSDGFRHHDGEEADGNHNEFNPPDDSPYSQVRASVSPTDDLSLSINTPRMWTLSLLFATLGSSTNLFFSLRYPSVSLSPIIALLLVHPLGLLWDRVFKRAGDPEETYVHGTLSRRGGSLASGGYDSLRSSADRLVQSATSASNSTRQGSLQNSGRDFRLWLAQGCWNEKEHTCVYISSNVSFGFAFATDVSN